VFSNGNTILGAGVVDNGYKLEISGNLYVNSIVNATTDTDRFIVSDGGLIKYRTGAQLLSDIGGQGSITLTTTGSSGPATLIGNTLNIPEYSTALTGYVPYSGATQDLDLGTYGLIGDFVRFNPSSSNIPSAEGVMSWDNTDGTVRLSLKGNTYSVPIGQSVVARVRNSTGTNLLRTNYQVVKVAGAQGQRLAVSLAQANNDANSASTIGLVCEDISNNQEGFIVNIGQIVNINTTGNLQGETWLDGDVLYLSPTIAGAITKVKPLAPQHTVILGYVEYAHANNGKIYVKIDNGYELEELHDVSPTPYINNGLLYRDTTLNLWKSATISTILGYTPAPQGNYITALTGEVTATGPGSVVATLSNSAVTGKVLTGLNVAGNAILSTDSILTAFGKLQHQVNQLVGGLQYQGTWNASTNTPTITSGVGTEGAFYIVSVAGTTNINGINDWQVGDWIVFHDIAWQKVDNSDSVSSVFGRVGNIVANQSDYSAFYPLIADIKNGILTVQATGVLSGSGTFSANQATNNTITLTHNSVSRTDTTSTQTPSFGGSFTVVDSVTSSAEGHVTAINTKTVTVPSTIASAVQTGLLSSADWSTFNAKMPAITFNAPLFIASGGDVGITQASGSTNGFLSSTDWTTFNNKQNALTNPVTGTGTTNYLPKFTGASTIGDSVIADNATEINIPKRIFLNSGGQSIFFTPNLSSASNRIEGSSGVPLEIFTSGSELRFAAGGVSTQVTLLSSGNVGIGTTSPGQRLVVQNSTDTFLQLRNSAAGQNFFIGALNGEARLNNDNSTPITMWVNGSERMRITSGGELLISGTYNPFPSSGRGNITLNGTSSNIITFTNNSAVRGYFFHTGTNFEILNGTTGGALQFYTESTERMRITSGGNVLIGTTTDAGFRLDVNGTGRFSGAYGTNSGLTVSGTTYGLIATNRGASSASAGMGYFNVGSQRWFTGIYENSDNFGFYSLGTAGFPLILNYSSGAATFSSSVFIGNADTNAFAAANRNVIVVNGATQSLIGLTTGSVNRAYLFHEGTNLYLQNIINGFTSFGTNDTERMRITSGGNVLIGTTTDGGARLRVNGDILIPADGRLYGNSATVTGSRSFINLYNGSNGNLEIQTGFSTAGIVFFTQQGNERMRITSGGSVIMGGATSVVYSEKVLIQYAGADNQGFHINQTGSTAANDKILFSNGNGIVGYIRTDGSTTSYVTSSDYRLKEDLKEINGIDKVSSLKVYNFKWKDSEERTDGVLAHELAEVLPYAVTGEKDGHRMQGVDYSKIVPVLIKAIQEQQEQIDKLKNS
jgi:hypothetical protein